MFGLMSPPPMKNLMIDGKKIPTGAAAAFIGDLYLNAGLEIPSEFNPIEETVRLVNALRAQGVKID